MTECSCHSDRPPREERDCGVSGGARITAVICNVTLAHRFDHLLARLGVNRSGHRVEPGLYSIGAPAADSPVFVTANYSLSFDALRSSLCGLDSYVLVLDTRGINVWCAAGKGTFGTEELVRRVAAANLGEVVSHRELVLPQLGATGVSAREVERLSGFSVRFGPVRANDIPEFMSSGNATRDMRTVRFGLIDRIVLIPVEFNYAVLPALVVAALLYLLAGPLAALALIASVVSGTVLFPMLLPWLPTPNFSTKGMVLGTATVLPFALALALRSGGAPAWARWVTGLAVLIGLPQVTAFLALNFTGSTTFTSRTGVKKEILSYFSRMVWLAGASLVSLLALAVLRWTTGI
jgi:hypothetical protein